MPALPSVGDGRAAEPVDAVGRRLRGGHVDVELVGLIAGAGDVVQMVGTRRAVERGDGRRAGGDRLLFDAHLVSP